MKKKFNQLDQLDGYTDNERYIHRWNINDGIFCIKIEDFVEMFNMVIVSRDFPNTYFGIQYDHQWAPSFGFPHPKNSNWINNKQFIFSLDNPTVKDFKVNIILQQDDPRFIASLHPPFKQNRVQMGLIVLKMSKIEDSVKFYEANKKVYIKKPTPYRTI